MPDAGDNTRWSFSPWNLFSCQYAHILSSSSNLTHVAPVSHLGCEIKMRSTPTKCIIAGNHITPGTNVRVESAVHIDILNPDTAPLRKTLARMQNLPLIGPLLAHAPGFYWSSLSEVGTGVCDWDEDF